jgi:hypothetical protein
MIGTTAELSAASTASAASLAARAYAAVLPSGVRVII